MSLSLQPQGWKMPLGGGNLHEVKPKVGGKSRLRLCVCDSLHGGQDLVVKALNHVALIYSNESTNNHLSAILRGTGSTPSAIGAKVSEWVSGIPMIQEQFFSRRF